MDTSQPEASVDNPTTDAIAMSHDGGSHVSSDALVLTVPGVFDLSGQPRKQYELHVTRVAKDILKEASNLATARPEGSRRKRTEFHSDHVDQAFALVAGRGLKRKSRPGLYTVGRIAQGVFTLVTGGAAALMALPDASAGWGYCFAACFAVTLLLIIVMEVADRILT